MSNSPLKPDILIFGGGIAGLWLINRLNAAGYRSEERRVGKECER